MFALRAGERYRRVPGEDVRDRFLGRSERFRFGAVETEDADRSGPGPQRYFEHAAELIEGLPPSRGKAETLAELARFAMFRDEDLTACELGREALQMSEDLGLHDVRVRSLNTLGTTRVKIGEIEGLADLERSLEISAIGSPERLRAYINLGSITADIGELTRSRAFHEEGLREAERVGGPGQRRWLFGDLTWDYYMLGRWDEALEGAEELLATSEGERHYIDSVAAMVRGLIRLARGDERGALDDSEASLAQARDSTDPQVLWPGLAVHANMLLRGDRRDDAAAVVDELLAELGQRDAVFVSNWSLPLAFALAELGRAEEFKAVVAKSLMGTRWLESAIAYVEGDFEGAAEILAKMGAIGEEAFVRLRGAELLVVAGRRAEADAFLQQALAFYRSVGATRYIREAEALFAASA